MPDVGRGGVGTGVAKSLPRHLSARLGPLEVIRMEGGPSSGAPFPHAWHACRGRPLSLRPEGG